MSYQVTLQTAKEVTWAMLLHGTTQGECQSVVGWETFYNFYKFKNQAPFESEPVGRRGRQIVLKARLAKRLAIRRNTSLGLN
jgi:hypothetical protein